MNERARILTELALSAAILVGGCNAVKQEASASPVATPTPSGQAECLPVVPNKTYACPNGEISTIINENGTLTVKSAFDSITTVIENPSWAGVQVTQDRDDRAIVQEEDGKITDVTEYFKYPWY